MLLLLLFVATVFTSYGVAMPGHIHPEVPNLRIFGGQEVTPHSAPYMVYLQVGGTCAGTILSQNYFLTAAHCMIGKSEWAALFGGHDVTNTTDPLSAIRFNGTYVTHPNYSVSSRENDIAIVNIPSGIPFNSYIQPVQLPSRQDVSKNYVGKTVKAYGWGRMDVNNLSKVLRTVDLKVSQQIDCKASFPLPISGKQLCTFAGVGKGTCTGDSGGPVMFGNVQVGLLSYGYSPCGSQYPEVDTRIDQYLDWIQANSDVIIN